MSKRIIVSLLAVLLVLVLGTAAADATGGLKTISAKALTDHECNSSEWHFVITQISSWDKVPGSITVNWANGQSQTVGLEKYTGHTAHYTTTSNLDSTVTSATTKIYSSWSGEFNLSHGPCQSQPTSTPITPTATEPATVEPTATDVPPTATQPATEEPTATEVKTEEPTATNVPPTATQPATEEPTKVPPTPKLATLTPTPKGDDFTPGVAFCSYVSKGLAEFVDFKNPAKSATFVLKAIPGGWIYGQGLHWQVNPVGNDQGKIDILGTQAGILPGKYDVIIGGVSRFHAVISYDDNGQLVCGYEGPDGAMVPPTGGNLPKGATNQSPLVLAVLAVLTLATIVLYNSFAKRPARRR